MKKIGILTFQKSFNYGAVLQAYATQKVIEDMGYDSYIVDYENEEEKKENKLFSFRSDKKLRENAKNIIRNILLKSYIIRKRNFTKFTNQMKKTDKVSTLQELEKQLEKFDVIVAGSDQIWNPYICGSKFEKAFLLDFKANKKISYASSAGSYIFNEEQMAYVKKCMNDFAHINVREEFLKLQFEKNGINNVSLVADPTLLMSNEDWRNSCYDTTIMSNIPDKYILVFLLQPYNEFCMNTIKTIKEKYKLPVISIGFTNRKKKYVDINLTNVTPERFITLIDNANAVITDSFHGHAFSINMNTNFFSILNPKNPIRVQNLLQKFELENRIVNDPQDINNINIQVDFHESNKKLKKFRLESLQILKESIEN